MWFDLLYKYVWINFFLFIVDLVYKFFNGFFKVNIECFLKIVLILKKKKLKWGKIWLCINYCIL